MTATVAKPVKSPCISICALDENDICSGCYRTGNEISHWGSYSEEQKLEVMKLVRERAKKNNPFA